MEEEGQNEVTLTVIPQAARGAAPVCTSALLSSDCSLAPLHPRARTHTHTFSALLALADTTGGRDQVAGASNEKRMSGGGGLTNESRQVTFTDVEEKKGRR